MMKNNMKKLIAWTAALFLIFQVLPMAAMADEVPGQGFNLDVLNTLTGELIDLSSFTKTAEYIIRDASTNKEKQRKEALDANDNPNFSYVLRLTVDSESGLTGTNEQMMKYPVPEGIAFPDGGDTTVSWEYNKAEKALVFSWKGEKAKGFTADIPCSPSFPGTLNLNGSYLVVSVKDDNSLIGMMTAQEVIVSGYKRLATKAVTSAGETMMSINEKGVDPVYWTFKQVSGDWYTISHGDRYLHMAGNHLTLTDGTNSQKFRISATASDANASVTGYRIDYGDKYVLNTKGANAANGMQGSAYYDQVIRLFTSKQLVDSFLQFNINNGTAESVPETITGSAGTTITLPDLAASRDGQEFIGWTDVPNILSTVSGVNHTYHIFYRPGTSYTIKSGSNTLYAVYNATNRDVQFGIRRDGVIVDEPNDNSVSNYIGHFTVKGILKEGHWVIDIDATKPVNGYYVANDVTANLTEVPSAEQIAAALKKEGKVDFDPETEYIHYYVLKYAGTKWKVDGVIRTKQMVGITYDVNAGDAEKTHIKNMPGGYQVVPGTDILIGADQNSTEIKRPTRDGYYFMGWNTAKDGTGRYYSEKDTVHLTENLYLYAQWVSAADNPMEIRITSDWTKGKVGYVGAKIKLTAELTGFDNRIYTLQWQYTTDLENWIDVPDAHDITYTYILDETTTHYTWRVVARDIQ